MGRRPPPSLLLLMLTTPGLELGATGGALPPPRHAVAATSAEASVSLNGAWSFELDETDAGLRGGFAQRPGFAHTISVPGVSIGAAGFGPSTDQKHHEYTGVSWYARNVTVPADWAAASAAVALSCGGVKSSATFWADGVEIGNHSGYMDGFELAIPSALLRQPPRSDSPAGAPRMLRLTARVDGAPVCFGTGSCFDANSGVWSGIWGEVALVKRSPLALTQLTARTLSLGTDSAAPAMLEVTALLGNGHADHAALLATGRLSLKSTITEHGEGGRVVVQQTLPLGDAVQNDDAGGISTRTHTRLRLAVSIPSPKLWSPRQPHLYHANWSVVLDAAGGGVAVGSSSSRAHARFGIRQLNVSGQHFLLNGKRHFLVGTGDDFGYPTEAPPQNLSVYRARLGAMREYGFDFVRLHSHFESKMYFDVADELGFFISPALPGVSGKKTPLLRHFILKMIVLPRQARDRYRENSKKEWRFLIASCKATALRTWKWWINELRNCPSVMDINMVNEAYGEPPPKLRPAGELGGWPGAPFPFRDEFYAVAKQMRPDLHVLDTDGCCWSSGQRNKAAVQETVDGPVCTPGKPSCLRLTRLDRNKRRLLSFAKMYANGTGGNKQSMAWLLHGYEQDICPEPYANGSCATPTNDFMTPSFGIQTPMVFTKMYLLRGAYMSCL